MYKKKITPYRSQAAQALHSVCLGFIYGNKSIEEVINSFCQYRRTKIAAFKEISINGHSLLMDILHLPFEIIKDVRKATDVTNQLINLYKKSSGDLRERSSKYKVKKERKLGDVLLSHGEPYYHRR